MLAKHTVAGMVAGIFEHGSYDEEYRLCYQNWSALDFLESHSKLLDRM